MAELTISGKIYEWAVGKNVRKYITMTLPYADFVRFIRPQTFDAQTGKGEQRSLTKAHVKYLKKQVEEGLYTPTSFGAALRDAHRKRVVVEGDSLTLNVKENFPLAQVDGNHRANGVGFLREELVAEMESAEGEEKARYQMVIDQIDRLPITVMVYLDSDPQEAFINLQKGRPMDKAQQRSMEINADMEDDESVKKAFEVARLLNKIKESPVFGVVRFDTKASEGNQIPFTTLTAKGGSDLATSLVGVVRACPKFDAEYIANTLVAAWGVLDKEASKIIDPDPSGGAKLLTPIGIGGTKGGTTLGIGVCGLMVYRLHELGQDQMTPKDEELFVKAVKAKFNKVIDGSLSGPDKRELMGDFAEYFLKDLPGDFHDDLPKTLLERTSPSSFGAASFPKATKGRGRPKKATVPVPDVDGEVNEAEAENESAA